MMIRVMIVDDEPFIRQGLKIIIDWNSLGYEIVAEASNGKEAISILQENKVDLVIADIKMPELNGLELIEQVKSRGISDAHFIILSGHYDFEYAKKAIKNNVTDYILKPIQKDELLRVIKEFKDVYDKREKDSKNHKRMEIMVFAKQLHSLIMGRYEESDLDDVKKKLTYTDTLRYISLEFSTFDEKFNELSEQDKYKQQKELYNFLINTMGIDNYHVVLDVSHQDNCYDVGFIFAKAFALQQGIGEREYIQSIFDKAKYSLKYKINLFIGQRVDGIEQISDSYKSAIIAKSFQAFRNDKEIAYYEETMNNKSNSLGIKKERFDALIRAVEEKNEEVMDAEIDAIYMEFKQHNMDPQIINLNIDYLLCSFIHLANELDPDVNQEEVLRQISQCAFDQVLVRGSVTHFKQFVKEFSKYLGQLRQNASRGVLSQIEREIEAHYMENLSLKGLSEKYYINSAYLGQIFKKQFGVSFKDYLNNYRIEKATELLLRTDEKVYMIAETVGYNNLDYFIHKFVGIKGKTPCQYRKQFLRQAEQS